MRHSLECSRTARLHQLQSIFRRSKLLCLVFTYACPAAFKKSWHSHNIPLIQGVHRFSAPWESNLRPWWRAAVSNLLEKYRRGRQVWTWLFESYSMKLTNNNLSLMTLPCCHSFHDACVIAWLSKAANCPLCRLNSRRLNFLQRNHTFATLPFKFSGLRCRLTTRSGRRWRNRRSARRREKKTWKPCTTACLAN